MKKLFKRKQRKAAVEDSYAAKRLPEHGRPDLTWFSTRSYVASNWGCTGYFKDKIKKFIDPMIKTADKNTAGDAFDPYIKGQLGGLEAWHEEDEALHDFQADRISAAIEVRKDELERDIERSRDKIAEIDAEIEPIKDVKAIFDVSIGGRHIPLAVIITAAAMIIDAFLNFSFLGQILKQSVLLIIVTVVGMSVLSDLSMAILGVFLARSKDSGISKGIRMTIICSLLGMFILSIVATVMIRFGSMSSTFVTVNLSGEFIPKDDYSLADYGITLITSFLTAATGIISYTVSADPNAQTVARLWKLKNRKEEMIKRINKCLTEREGLELASDPKAVDAAFRAAAKSNLLATETELKLYARSELALKEQDAGYLDIMSESAEMLVGGSDGNTAVKANNIEIFNKKGAV